MGRVFGLPLIAWVYETLQQDDNGRVAKEYFVERLPWNFGQRVEERINIGNPVWPHSRAV